MHNTELRLKFKQVAMPTGVFDARAVRRMKADIDAAVLEGYPTFKDKVCALVLDLHERIKCQCGKTTALISTTKGYRKFCSAKCSATSTETVAKRKQTCVKLFGVENAASSGLVKAKIKKTCNDRYGVAAAIGSGSIKEKIKNTVLAKYGVENVMQNSQVKANFSASYAKKPDKDEIKLKRKKTVLAKFGCEYTLQDPYIRDAIKLTNIAKYGNTTALHGTRKDTTIKSRRSTYIKKYLETRLLECVEAGIFPVGWEIQDYTDGASTYKFFHQGCGKEFLGQFKNSSIPRCPECQKVGSAIEHRLFGDIKKHFPEAIQHDRSRIKPREIDILVGDVGIEINGAYWHRDELGKPILEKTKAFEGTLIHLWDFELDQKYDICLSLVLSKLGKFERRISARKCELRYVPYSEARTFFEKNHLRGSAAASRCYGLYYSGELIQAISISKSRYSKKADLELIRSATSLGTQVVGGMSKLMCRLKKDHSGKILLTYADRRYSKSTAYSKWFLLSHITPPNYFWFKSNSILPRHQTQRHKLHKLFDDVSDVDTEKSILSRHGYFKVSDCGNLALTTVL